MIVLTVAIHRPFISSDLTMRQVFPHLLVLPTRSGEYRQAAGAIASVIATLLSRQCGYSAVSLVSRMNFLSIWRALLVSRINFFQLAKPSRTSLSKDEARRVQKEGRPGIASGRP
jgi:hypothetical protein